MPHSESITEEYERFWKLTDIFLLKVSGISTKRDRMVIDFEQEPILERVNYFRNSTESNERLCEQLPINMIDEWDISMARETLRTERDINQYIQSILYRLYDKRSIFYHDDLVARPRRAVMKHLIAGENIAMCVGRAGQAVEDTIWNLVSISDVIVDLNIFRRGGNLVFPLYCYADQRVQRAPNISQQFQEEVCRHLNYENDHDAEIRFIHNGKGDCNTTIGPEDLFHYTYAILHAPEYRKRYTDQLKIDFPHIPLTTNRPLFQKLVLSGEQLVESQLFQSENLNLPAFPVSGNQRSEDVRWTDEDQQRLDKSNSVFRTRFTGGLGISCRWTPTC